MAEQDKPKTESRQSAKEVAASPEGQPVSVRGLQRGEQVPAGTVTTRVPRGVGEPAADAKAEHRGVRAVQEQADKVEAEGLEKGYRGDQIDPTPRENYTLRGVGQGLPTPETAVFTPRGR